MKAPSPFNRLLTYNTSTQTYDKYTRVQAARFCNGYTVNNTGTTLVIVNQIVVQPQQSISFGGNYGEVYEGMIEVNFTTQTPPPSTVVNQAVIIQKFYTNIDCIDP